MKTYSFQFDRNVPLGVECALPPIEAARASREGRIGRVLVALAMLLSLFGAWQLGRGLYIHAKAQLAQVLLERAWERTLAGGRRVKPWSWADTWPVARLSVPEKGVDLFVLAGANGRAIAFGPGHMFGTALPGEEGNSVIGGHRDTHLAFLRGVKPGTEIDVQRMDGEWRRYRVEATDVLDKNETWVTKQDGWTRLTLVTCWPFDALRAGGPLRYVVFADAIGN